MLSEINQGEGSIGFFGVLIHCVSWNAFGGDTGGFEIAGEVLIHCVSWNAFGGVKSVFTKFRRVVLIHCVSWNAFGGCHSIYKTFRRVS